MPSFHPARQCALALLLAVSSASVPAQDASEMLEKQMAEMAKVQECMSRIDQSELEAIAAHGEKIEAEIRAMCQAGKRDDAQRKAMSYGMEMESAPVVKQMRDCGMSVEVKYSEKPAAASQHVCDEVNQ